MKGKTDEQIIKEACERIHNVPIWLPFSSHDVPVASRDFDIVKSMNLRPVGNFFYHLVRFKKVFTSLGPQWEFECLVK
ncbi:hypothetical protein LZD49_12510 [Dyadobacter sp. CY261]|uniref:hypothetical protein n=1 Tax=Dyadobacter sp. CY261 TaxID=2907203 RepID=UPI001F1BD88A|nr:hypothetical protein [Dyadobacter sp. CY261]MCF0071295.1 hypothetical protein [Dyadobacter sp. CY261]